MTQKLFRPYLALPEINFLLELISHSTKFEEGKSVYTKLFKLKIQAEMGLRQADHVMQPSLEQKLGFASSDPFLSVPLSELWEAFNKNPSSLSVQQIKKAKTYAWEQGLMSPVEAANFEKEIGL